MSWNPRIDPSLQLHHIHAELTGKLERETGSWQCLAYLNQSSCKKTLNMPIVFDTGASFSLTPYEGDFVGEIEEPTIKELIWHCRFCTHQRDWMDRMDYPRRF